MFLKSRTGHRRTADNGARDEAGSRRGEFGECNSGNSFCQGIPPCDKLISRLKSQPGSRASGERQANELSTPVSGA